MSFGYSGRKCSRLREAIGRRRCLQTTLRKEAGTVPGSKDTGSFGGIVM